MGDHIQTLEDRGGANWFVYEDKYKPGCPGQQGMRSYTPFSVTYFGFVKGHLKNEDTSLGDSPDCTLSSPSFFSFLLFFGTFSHTKRSG